MVDQTALALASHGHDPATLARVCASVLVFLRIVAAVGAETPRASLGSRAEVQRALTHLRLALAVEGGDTECARGLLAAVLHETPEGLVELSELGVLNLGEVAAALRAFRTLLDESLLAADAALARPTRGASSWSTRHVSGGVVLVRWSGERGAWEAWASEAHAQRAGSRVVADVALDALLRSPSVRRFRSAESALDTVRKAGVRT